MFVTLVAAVVATVTTRPTPAAAARSSTAGRSSRKRSSSRCAWESKRFTSTHRRRGLGLVGEALEGGQVAPLRGEQLVQEDPGLAVAELLRFALQGGDRFTLVLDQERQQVVERNVVDGREVRRI